jgi:transcriptional regulator with XRE-family HTH domain
MDRTNEIVSANLVKLRKSRKLTQAELAEQIHYSDKSISKWEIGESCPSISVALEIAKFYGVTLNDLVNEDLETEEISKEKKQYNYSRLIITLLACSVVWLIATLAFIYGMILTLPYQWLYFLYAVPVTCIVLIVFNSIWGNRRLNYTIISVFTWSSLATAFFHVLAMTGHVIWIIFIIGVPVQVSIVLWSQLKGQTIKNFIKKKNSN